MKPKIFKSLEVSWLTPLALALIAICLFVLSLGDRKKEDLNSRSLERMAEITHAQISLHSSILKSRVYYLNHFDGIVQDQKQLLAASAALMHGATLDSKLQRLRSQLMEQDRVIEDFKSNLSVYKNSEQYIGVIIDEFLVQTSALPRQEFLTEFAQFHNHFSIFRMKPDAEQKALLKTLLERLERHGPSLPDKDRAVFDQILAHSKLIMDRAGRIDESLARILDEELDRTIEAVQAAFVKEQVAIRSSLKNYEKALYSIIVVLTLYTFFVLVRLKLSNDRLEQRVQERTRELAIASQKAIEADSAKTAFLAHMSHEIRTPLNGVIGLTSILLKRDLPAQEKEMVYSVSYCGKSLLALINNILDFSKIEANKLKLDSAPYSLVDVIDESLTIVSTNAIKDNVRIVKEVSPDLPALIQGDRDRVGQILLNLLSNAIKFSKNGRVVIKLDAESVSTGSYQITLSVIDNGIGIEEHHLQNLFQEFSQAHSSIQSSFGGTGLGLAIAKKLAELMGGKITVKSQYGVGSTFSFHFPATVAESPGAESHELLNQRLLSEDYPHKILVVDDNFINRKVAGELLASLGYTPGLAKDGPEALDLLSHGDYDLVFTDLRMPHMDGYELVRTAKALIQKPLRFVAMTASATVEEKEKCLQQGITHFISKPIKEQDLVQILREKS